MFGWFKKKVKASTAGVVFDPALENRFPGVSEFVPGIEAMGIFSEGDVYWIAETVVDVDQSGSSFKSRLASIALYGELLTPEELKARGINARRKIGRRFAEAVGEHDVIAAMNELEVVIHTVTSRWSKLQKIKSAVEDVGITHFELLSPHDERETEIERQYNGKRLTTAEAVALINDHARDIRRSVFIAEVNF